MSGSERAITLNLSVRDAEVVRNQLLSMGEAGDQALKKIEEASARAASPQGVPSVGASLQTVGAQAKDAFEKIQRGESAFASLIDSAKSIAANFGPAGAVIAGVLTLLPQLIERYIGVRDAAENLIDAENRSTAAIAASRAIYESAADAAKRLADERLRVVAVGLEERLTRERESLRAVNADAGVLGVSPATDPIIGGRKGGLRNPARIRQMQQEAEAVNGPERLAIAAEAQVISDRIAALDAELTTIRAMNNSGAVSTVVRGNTPSAARETQRDIFDVVAALERMRTESQTAFDAFNESLNLNSANLDGASTVLARYQRDMEMLEIALLRGAITQDQFNVAVEGGSIALARQIEEIEKRGQRADDIGRSLGLTFTSAFEDAIIKGKSFRDVIKGIEQDIAKLIIRKSITEPAANAISGAIPGSGISSIFSNLFGGSSAASAAAIPGGIGSATASAGGFLFASGGIMTGAGPVPLRRYANGGIANSSQLAMFGEGSTPEAYVPLPDGRSIPVKMQGGGTNFAPVYNIDARGADPSILPRMHAIARATSAQAVAQFAESIQRGGSAARLVGRR